MNTSLLTSRLLGLSALLALGTAGRAQEVGPTAEQTLNQVFGNLHAERDVELVLAGTDRVGTTSNPFSTRIVWHQVGDGDRRTLKVALQRTVNGTLVFEARANGASLITYDYVNKTYSASPYHQPKDPKTPDLRDENYLNRLVSSLVKVSTSNGPDSYAVRLISEALGNSAGQSTAAGLPVSVQYRSWMPSRQPVELPATLPPTTYPDPVMPTNLRAGYTPTENYRFFVYNGAPKRSLAFETYQSDPAGSIYDTSLYAVYFAERSKIGNRDRLIDWAMSVRIPTVTEDYEAQFAPYSDMRGWRPLASPGAPKG